MSNQYPVCSHCGERHKVCETSIIEQAGLEYIATPRKEQYLFINQRLDGLNEVIDQCRTHWTRGAKHKRVQQDIVCYSIKQCKLKPINGPFRMEIHFSEPNAKRDPDNIASSKKIILDALQEMEIIPKDNQKYVMGWTETWGLATEAKPVGVHIKLIED